MRIAVACGGTGGHVFPGLTTANTLAQRGHEAALWLAGRDVEGPSLDGWHGSCVFIGSAGLSERPSVLEVFALARLAAAALSARREMRKRRPDVVLGMGSYASVGPVLAARSLGIPYVLHEANAVPGRAVSWLEKSAAAVAVAFEPAVKHLSNRRVVVTGFPVRTDLGGRFEDGELEEGRFTVMAMGGSQGARVLDETVSTALCSLRERGVDVQVIHLARPENREQLERKYRAGSVPGPVFGFLKEIGKAYNSADVAVVRAGAGTCAELRACRLPGLLVPLPSARRDHQMLNATVMRDAGMAEVVAQAGFSAEWLANWLETVIRDPSKLDRMRCAMEKQDGADAAGKLADLVEEAGR